MRRFKKSLPPIPVSTIALVLTLALGMLACETPFRGFRATTFPPDLSYLPPARIRTVMWVLAGEIQHLEQLLNQPERSAPPNRQSEVSKTLERMQVAMRTLDEPGRTNQHPLLNENFERFLDRLERAKRSVDREPPNYFYASTIAGSCSFCHAQSRATALAPGVPGAS